MKDYIRWSMDFTSTQVPICHFWLQSPYVIPVGAYEEERDGDYSLAYFSSSGIASISSNHTRSRLLTLARNGERLTGTTLSAPYVAATIALMLQQNPDLNLQQITSNIIHCSAA